MGRRFSKFIKNEFENFTKIINENVSSISYIVFVWYIF